MTVRNLRTFAFGLCAFFVVPAIASAATAPSPCGNALSQRTWVRPPSAPSGSEFTRRIALMSDDEREAAIETALLAGDMPSFLKQLAPVTLEGETPDGRSIRVTVCVAPDYLAVGSGSDFLYVPMRLGTALRIAHHYGFTLPTAKIVDAIYEQSVVRLKPQPLPAGDQMRSTGYYRHHSDLIDQQRRALGAATGVLTAGHKKDLVLTNRLRRLPDRVAIYGWHWADNDPIQPLSTLHGARYADYSHGVRLVSTVVYVNGEARSIFDVLADPVLAPVLSDEGPIPELTTLTASLSAPAAQGVALPGSDTTRVAIARSFAVDSEH
ncbi:MAG TPA: hypothetical protein VLX09_07735 [Stellaceae bacterium]|nr:hypothetical protein [Stellaceae bacterium]